MPNGGHEDDGSPDEFIFLSSPKIFFTSKSDGSPSRYNRVDRSMMSIPSCTVPG